MKLGNIKIQSLSLIYPDWSVEYDEGNLDDVIFGLKSNPNFSSYLSASVGAINRAFSIIEESFLSPKGIKTIPSTNIQNRFGGTVFSLDDDIFKVCTVLINGTEVDFELITKKLIKVALINSSDSVEVIYLQKINRINHETGSGYEVDLGGIEEFIPYFVKSELSGQDSEEGKNALKIFEDILDKYSGIFESEGFVKTVYSIRRI